jgi:hypothetical protein
VNAVITDDHGPQPRRGGLVELRLVAALRRAAWQRGGPLPSIAVADALLDERRERRTANMGDASLSLQRLING